MKVTTLEKFFLHKIKIGWKKFFLSKMKFILILFFCVSAVFGRICFQSTTDYKKSFGECSSTDYCFTADLISQRSGEQVVRGCGSGDILTHGYGVQSCDEFGVWFCEKINVTLNENFSGNWSTIC